MSDATMATEIRLTPSPRPVRSLGIIIPGGEGHLGRILARHLSGKGHTVSTLTRKAPMTAGMKASATSVAVKRRKTLYAAGALMKRIHSSPEEKSERTI
jgi:hypothetical protein